MAQSSSAKLKLCLYYKHLVRGCLILGLSYFKGLISLVHCIHVCYLLSNSQQVDLGTGGDGAGTGGDGAGTGGDGAGTGGDGAGTGGDGAGNGANGDGGANQQALPATVAVPPNPIQNDGPQQGNSGNSANDSGGANPQVVPAAVVAEPAAVVLAPIQGGDGQPGDDGDDHQGFVPQAAGQHAQQPELVFARPLVNNRPPNPARPPPLDNSTGQPASP